MGCAKTAQRGKRCFNGVMQCEECPGDAEARISCVAASCVYGVHSAAAAVPKNPRTARSHRPSNATINEAVYYATAV